APRRALAFWALVPKRASAVPLEARDGHIAVAAQREGAGRVVQIGYEDTWRWRMSGDESAPAAHRAWWSALVSSAAYRAAIAIAAPSADAAPLAHLVAALGPPSALPNESKAPANPGIRAWLIVAAVMLLLAEWASRRMRGEV
ncbi:MAG: hypothetical protein M3081_18830, partial [Gemmatimonadota bacterium]|nr:hypothetical protein [Gemmatimonadota bacterium]